MYGSGTQVVTSHEPGTPWLYVYGPSSDDDSARVQNRFRVCEDLVEFLNGGERPAWLDDMHRVSESCIEDYDGTHISATGPMVDATGSLCWRQCDSQQSQDARARLIDRLMFKQAGAH